MLVKVGELIDTEEDANDKDYGTDRKVFVIECLRDLSFFFIPL